MKGLLAEALFELDTISCEKMFRMFCMELRLTHVKAVVVVVVVVNGD